jgi:hypothetical protein
MSNKIGINISIDVKKLDKNKFFVSQKTGATYADLTIFIDPDNPDQYDNHGFITQSVTKEEKAQGVKGVILGNGKVFWREGGQSNQNQVNNNHNQVDRTQSSNQAVDNFDDDIPF